jgi:hypothetical protein
MQIVPPVMIINTLLSGRRLVAPSSVAPEGIIVKEIALSRLDFYFCIFPSFAISVFKAARKGDKR